MTEYEKKERHSKYYYEKDRNINPKMLMSKQELGIDYSKDKTPNYYIGKGLWL